MMFSTIFVSVLFSVMAQAAPLIGYSTPDPDNQYRILNAKGQQIYDSKTDATSGDMVKRVDLRDGLALVQTRFNTVSLIREDGNKTISSVYGSEVKISNRLVAIYNKNGVGAVYTVDGKKLYPQSAAEAVRPVKEIKIANNRFALIDAFTDTFRAFDQDGNETAQFRGIQKFRITDGFLALTTTSDSTMIFGESTDQMISTLPNISGLQVTDEFASLFDAFGNLRLYSRKSGELALRNNISDVTLTNYYAILEGPNGTEVVGKSNETLDLIAPNGSEPLITSHAVYAYRANTGVVYVKNAETGQTMNISMADDFVVMDDLVLARNGVGQYRIYSLKKGSFGRFLHTELNPMIAQIQLGNGAVSFQTGFFNAKTYETRIYTFNENAIKTTLVDETRINSVDLSVNREEWNWL